MNNNEDYERQFNLKEKEIETKNAVQFQDLLNSCVAYNLAKKKELFETFEHEEEEQPIVLQDIDQIRVMSEQMQTMQRNLQSKYMLIKNAKLMFEKRVNQLREALSNIRMKNVEVNDDQVIKELHQANKRMLAFQQLADRFRKNQLKKFEQKEKELQQEQEQLRLQQQRIQELKNQNHSLLMRIEQLKLEEHEKKKKLHECYQTSEYIEFFTEVKALYSDEDQSSLNSSRQIRGRQSTRNEIVTMMDEFYNSQNIEELSNEITNYYRTMVEALKNGTKNYNSLIEEKTVRKAQLEEVCEEVSRLRNFKCVVEDNEPVDLALNTQQIEGPQVFHENHQLSYHIRLNQLCLLNIHMKMIDMITRVSLGVIWLSETSKSVPPKLDNLCSQYLKLHTKAEMKLFIPETQRIQTKKLGTFVSILNRNKTDGSPKGSSTNITSNSDKSFDNDQAIQNLLRFKQKQGYDIIQSSWLSIVKNDLLTYKFVKEINLDQIELNQPVQDIVIQLYIVYAEAISKINYFYYYEQELIYYRDILRSINSSKQKIINAPLHSMRLLDSTILSNSYTPNKFIQATYQGQLKRLLDPPKEEEEPIVIPDNVKKIQKTSDESKFHQFFIQQSSIIQRKSPLLHEKLISQTLQTIDQMRKKELDDNYQTSDMATSDNDYLNQERRNLKGMLNKKQQQSQTARSEEKDSITSRSIMKQVSLLSKISHLSRVNQNSNYASVNKSIQKLNNTVQKKIQEYFTQDPNRSDTRIRYPPIEKKTSSRSPQDINSTILEPSPKGRSFIAII